MLDVEPSTITVNIIRVTANKEHQVVVVIAMCSSDLTFDVSIEFALKLKEDVGDNDHISTQRCWLDLHRSYEFGASRDIIRRVQLAFAQINTWPEQLRNGNEHTINNNMYANRMCGHSFVPNSTGMDKDHDTRRTMT